MRKHLKLIIILLIVAIAGGAVVIHKKIEKKNKDNFAITVTVDNKVNGQTYLNKFKFIATKKNLAAFLENNNQVFNPEFKTSGNSEYLTGLLASENGDGGNWTGEYTANGVATKITSSTDLTSIPTVNDSTLTFTYQK